MASVVTKSRKKKQAHPYLNQFLRDLLKYRDDLHERLGDSENDLGLFKTTTAIILKACFLKLSQEKGFLSIDNLAVFKDLIKLRRHACRPSNQLDMWRGDNVRVAIDNLLEDLRPDSKVVAKARLARLHGILQCFRLEVLDRDILGAVYQALKPVQQKKQEGQYFTPPSAVDTLLKGLDLDPIKNQQLSILDPACGSGQFLLGVYDHLKLLLTGNGMSNEQAHEQILERHLYGFDVDPFALLLSKMNLFLKERIKNPIKFNIHLVNTLAREEHRLFVDIKGVESMVGKFDRVVGNPPWGSKLSANEKREYKKSFKSASSGVNSFTLFLERSLELVKPSGKVGFLIPEAYLNIKAHRASRKLLLNLTAIEHIITCGELFKGVFAPSLLIVTRLEPNALLRRNAHVKVTRDHATKLESFASIRQQVFLDTPENIINIHLDDQTRSILNKISKKTATLKGYSHFGLGLVTGNNAKLVKPQKLDKHHENLIVGRDLTAYRIKKSTHFIVYDRNELQQACPRKIFDAPKKLIYRFISKRLTFAVDEQSRFTLNNANVLVPQLPGFRIKYLLALLNSPLIQFYYTFTFFTLKVLRGNLERLPLKWVSENVQLEIEQLVDQMLDASPEMYDDLKSQIETQIYKIYQLSEDEIDFIKTRLQIELGYKTADVELLP